MKCTQCSKYYRLEHSHNEKHSLKFRSSEKAAAYRGITSEYCHFRNPFSKVLHQAYYVMCTHLYAFSLCLFSFLNVNTLPTHMCSDTCIHTYICTHTHVCVCVYGKDIHRRENRLANENYKSWRFQQTVIIKNNHRTSERSQRGKGGKEEEGRKQIKWPLSAKLAIYHLLRKVLVWYVTVLFKS